MVITLVPERAPVNCETADAVARQTNAHFTGSKTAVEIMCSNRDVIARGNSRWHAPAVAR
jgi:hypothetical protein